MVIYKNSSLDPYFNLAAEQYLLDTKEGSMFMLWRNDNAVIIGKNQNAYAELDLDYVQTHGIKVVRRLTGGGAVFHDKGNINFSFIVPESQNATLDFARFTKPVIDAIASLGVEDICLSGRNDIMIGSTKISGNAQSSYNGKTLHHGTLLYSSDLTMLAGALKADPEKIKSKGIKSVRNRVSNIKEHLDTDMSVEEFMDYIEGFIARENDGKVMEFSKTDIEKIQKIADEKYSAWEWNFGKSKEFIANKKRRYPFGSVGVDVVAENGIIKNLEIYGDFFGVRDISDLVKTLSGVRYDRAEIEKNTDEKILSQCIAGMTAAEFAELLTL